MTNKTAIEKLQDFIEKLKAKYPECIYINNLANNNHGHYLDADAYAIVVEDIPKNKYKAFLDFIDEAIYFPLLDSDEELPTILPLTKAE